MISENIRNIEVDMKKFILAVLLLIANSINGEVISVTLKWDPLVCFASCNTQLAQQFQKIPGVADMRFNPDMGQVTLIWKPNMPFSFAPLNNALRYVGPKLLGNTISIRGTIERRGNDYYIRSLGDNTLFQLLGALKYEQNRYTIEHSVYNHPIEGNTKMQLDDAMLKHKIAKVDGYLFEPQWMTLRVVITNMNFEQPAG